MSRIAIDPFPAESKLNSLFESAWGSARPGYAAGVLERSLAHIGAYDDERLVGFVNVAWDGGVHAFLLDTTVAPEWQRQGLATKLVQKAAEVARERGAEWLHVDYEPHLEGFYRGCGFGPTAAGLMALR